MKSPKLSSFILLTVGTTAMYAVEPILSPTNQTPISGNGVAPATTPPYTPLPSISDIAGFAGGQPVQIALSGGPLDLCKTAPYLTVTHKMTHEVSSGVGYVNDFVEMIKATPMIKKAEVKYTLSLALSSGDVCCKEKVGSYIDTAFQGGLKTTIEGWLTPQPIPAINYTAKMPKYLGGFELISIKGKVGAGAFFSLYGGLSLGAYQRITNNLDKQSCNKEVGTVSGTAGFGIGAGATADVAVGILGEKPLKIKVESEARVDTTATIKATMEAGRWKKVELCVNPVTASANFTFSVSDYKIAYQQSIVIFDIAKCIPFGPKVAAIDQEVHHVVMAMAGGE